MAKVAPAMSAVRRRPARGLDFYHCFVAFYRKQRLTLGDPDYRTQIGPKFLGSPTAAPEYGAGKEDVGRGARI